MILPKILGEYKLAYNLAHLTWFKVGGNAEFFLKPKDKCDLANFLLQNNNIIPTTILGAGSNIIIRDTGIDGVVIKLGQNFTNIELLSDSRISVGAGCLNFNLAKFCERNCITGFEFLIGVPGTIGGGVAMNAGSYGSEFKDIVVEIEAIDSKGEIINLSNNEIGFKYRGNDLPKDLIITNVIFRGNIASQESITSLMHQITEKRLATQPIKERTGGSTFANPEGHSAWKLIDQCGLRGYRLGGASISDIHCNFMINNGNATAKDLEDLGELVIKKVAEDTGILLKWEIKRIGKL